MQTGIKTLYLLQDSGIALQSLAKYSELQVDVKLDLKIVIMPSYIPNGLANSISININKENALLQQSFDVSHA